MVLNKAIVIIVNDAVPCLKKILQRLVRLSKFYEINFFFQFTDGVRFLLDRYLGTATSRVTPWIWALVAPNASVARTRTLQKNITRIVRNKLQGSSEQSVYCLRK